MRRRRDARRLLALCKCVIMPRMKTTLARRVALLGFAWTVGGCVVQERVVERRPPPPCYGGVWIPGHTGQNGYWRPGHWRCPGVVEVVVAD